MGGSLGTLGTSSVHIAKGVLHQSEKVQFKEEVVTVSNSQSHHIQGGITMDPHKALWWIFGLDKVGNSYKIVDSWYMRDGKEVDLQAICPKTLLARLFSYCEGRQGRPRVEKDHEGSREGS
ncbi:hypothetical protein L195_g000369 [Trifolium pratense]|uniref:Uncharacterized protein n=1 Tax=Trifolium pratense TaxID=57577 RepID=A0A2K3NLN7_TRIPR|nr:hypothetical protein L195_g000369 [Trifolium pratense]